MSEIKPIQVLTSVTGPGYVDLMEYFSPVDDADDGSEDRIIFVGYDAKTLGVDGIFHVVCAIPKRERQYAELIVTAVNAHEALVEALEAFERWEADVILNGDWSGATVRLTQAQHDALSAVQDKRNAALKLARADQ